MKITWLIIVTLLILLHQTKDATGTMCYQCNTLYHDDCHRIHLNASRSLHYKPCDSSSYDYPPFCRKIVQKIRVRDNLVRVIRTCGWEPQGVEDTCYRVANEDHEEIVCQCFSDGCNSASELKHHRLLLILLIIMSYFTLHRCY